MKKTQTITRSNYHRLIDNVNSDLDFCFGSTRFKHVSKFGSNWSYRFFKVDNGLYQTKSRLGHTKETWSFAGSLETIFEQILDF